MRILEKSLRLWSGLTIAIFVILHLINHSLGLVSLEAMEGMRAYMSAIWFDFPGAVPLFFVFVFSL